MINQCYEYEAAHTIQDVLSCNGDLNIALVADSHLDNSVPATIGNISAVDQAVQHPGIALKVRFEGPVTRGLDQ